MQRCVFEPEVHMGLSAQGKLLEVLYELTTLWRYDLQKKYCKKTRVKV